MIDPVFDRRLGPRRRWKHLLWFTARLVILPLLFVTLRLRVHGLKHVPRSGGAIVVSNHIDFFDPVLIVAGAPRPVLWMAKSEVFNYPVLRWFARQAGAFAVERGTPDRSALRHAEALLAEGMLVGMFPEGTRSRTGGLIAPFSGASMVAVRSRALIIPCAIVGSEALPLRGFAPHRPGRWPRVDILFGEPFTLAATRPDGTRWRLEELTDAMMIEVARLLPPAYRGVYADRCVAPHPAVQREAGSGVAA